MRYGKVEYADGLRDAIAALENAVGWMARRGYAVSATIAKGRITAVGVRPLAAITAVGVRPLAAPDGKIEEAKESEVAE